MPKLTPLRLLGAMVGLVIARSLPVPMQIAMLAVMAGMAMRLWYIGLCHDAGGRYGGNLVTPRCEGATLPPLVERSIGEGQWGLVACTSAVALAVAEGFVRWVKGS